MSWPEKMIWPLRGSMAPATPRRLVVLPAPLAPMRVTISPSATSKEMSRTAGTSPYASSRVCPSSSKFPAKVGRDHRRVALHFARRAFEQRLAVVHDEYAVGDVHHQVHVVLDHHHRDAAPAELLEPLQQELDLGGVQPGRRLVEHEQARPRRQRARDLQHALLPVRQRAGALAGTRLQPDEREQRARFLAEAPGIAVNEIFPQRHVLMDVEAGEHVLEQRELLEEADLLEGASDAEPHAAVRRQADQACLFKMQGSGIGLVEARQQVEQRRLAGAVRPDQREDRFFRHADRNVLHRAHAAEALADLFGLQNHRMRARNVIHAWTMPPSMNSTTSVRAIP